MSGQRPKYLDIRDDLAERIRRREFTSGQPLPSQATLSKQYGVTLMTLRQALRCLQDDDVIVQMPGRGTFVMDSPTLDLRHLVSLVTELAAQGVPLRTHVLDKRFAAIPAAVASPLGCARDMSGLRLERLRTVNSVPVVHQVSWVPEPWAERLADVEFESASLYGSLEGRCGLTMTAANETLRARALSRATARATGARAGRPTLVAQRVTFDEHGTPVVHDLATILDTAVRVEVRRAPRRADSKWVAAP